MASKKPASKQSGGLLAGLARGLGLAKPAPKKAAKAAAKPAKAAAKAKPVAKKAAKPAAKKAPAKKPATKKAAPKTKPVAKKVIAKPAAKKAVAKPVKAAPKKPAAKVKPAPKPAAKKVATKPASKKTAAKPAAKPIPKAPATKKVAAPAKPATTAVAPKNPKLAPKEAIDRRVAELAKPVFKPSLNREKPAGKVESAERGIPQLDSEIFDQAYDAAKVEPDMSRLWDYFELGKASGKSAKNAFTMMLPPPNVTGVLHLGHAATIAIEDIMARSARMQGKDVLWLPGTDHAGISTQVVVEKNLAKEGLNRHDMGREKFLEKVWEWKDYSHGVISKQIQSLGGSLDWSRERFTLDAGYQKAVFEAFKRLYDKGLIYRKKRLVNWDPVLQSVVSDLEVIHKEEEGSLYFVRYFVNATDRSICVATTRPETMLGDVAVAVHPDDPRYQEFIGKKLILPIANRLIPVIADKRVDMHYGTGAVKLTPAHDPLDAQIAETHNLPSIVVIGPHGRMTKHAGKFRGIPIHEARKSIIRYLDDIGNLEKVQKHLHNVAYSERTGMKIEPLESMQWFVSMKPLAELAMKSVRRGEIEFVPARFEKEFMGWMENLQDWCISRQLWWGHQIPVWYLKKVQPMKKYEKYPEIVVSEQDPGLAGEYKGAAYEQDPDVLDTWFSSGLWPFATLGWPDKTKDLETFFPNTILETGRDILFFWVARMITMSLGLVGKVPFKTVYLHGLVVDEDGQKMSKSKGNGVDPLDMIREYGTDALRLALISGSTPGTDTRFGLSKITGKRNFVNKLWNVARFILQDSKLRGVPARPVAKTLQDQWILSRLNRLIDESAAGMSKYAFAEVAQKIEDFVWKEFADWYLELSKETRNESVLRFVLAEVLKLLHPFAPFVTERIWQELTRPAKPAPSWKPALLAREATPTANKSAIKASIEAEMQAMLAVISGIRSIRNEYQVEPGRLVSATIHAGKAEATLKKHAAEIKKLARLGSLTIKKSGQPLPNAASKIEAEIEIYLPLDKLLDPKVEVARLAAEQAEVEKFLKIVELKLANQDFVKRAPAAVVEGERTKQRDATEKLKKIVERLEQLKKLK